MVPGRAAGEAPFRAPLVGSEHAWAAPPLRAGSPGPRASRLYRRASRSRVARGVENEGVRRASPGFSSEERPAVSGQRRPSSKTEAGDFGPQGTFSNTWGHF